MSKLVEILPKACESKSSLIARYVLPLYIELLASKGDIQTGNERMIKVLRNELGKDVFFEIVCSLPIGKQSVIKQAMGIN